MLRTPICRVISSKPIAYLLSLTRRSGCKGKGFFAFHPNFFSKFFWPLFRSGKPLQAPFSTPLFQELPRFISAAGCKGNSVFSFLPNLFFKNFSEPPNNCPLKDLARSQLHSFSHLRGAKIRAGMIDFQIYFKNQVSFFWE